MSKQETAWRQTRTPVHSPQAAALQRRQAEYAADGALASMLILGQTLLQGALTLLPGGGVGLTALLCLGVGGGLFALAYLACRGQGLMEAAGPRMRRVLALALLLCLLLDGQWALCGLTALAHAYGVEALQPRLVAVLAVVCTLFALGGGRGAPRAAFAMRWLFPLALVACLAQGLPSWEARRLGGLPSSFPWTGLGFLWTLILPLLSPKGQRGQSGLLRGGIGLGLGALWLALTAGTAPLALLVAAPGWGSRLTAGLQYLPSVLPGRVLLFLLVMLLEGCLMGCAALAGRMLQLLFGWAPAWASRGYTVALLPYALILSGELEGVFRTLLPWRTPLVAVCLGALWLTRRKG